MLAVLATCLVVGAADDAPARRVYVGAYLHDITEFDLKNGVFDVDLELWAKWLGDDFDPGDLDIANAAEPATEANIDTDDPQGFAHGDIVAVVPDEDGGDPVVVGKLQVLTRERITLLRQDERVNMVCVHFPRVGYRVSSI